MPKRIALTQGQFALVDDEWYDELSQWNWQAKWDRTSKSYYAMRSIRRNDGKRTTELMHRRITGFAWRRVDHANHDTLDNRASNLRDGSEQNNQNRRPRPAGTVTSAYHGVSLDAASGKWLAQIQVRGRNNHVGRFTSEVDAAFAYDRASRELHGEYGTRNF